LGNIPSLYILIFELKLIKEIKMRRTVYYSLIAIYARIVALSFVFLLFPLLANAGDVRIWEGTITLPTYRVNAPEKAPLFSRDFAYQRARRGVYPYAMNDNPTYDKVDSTHRALFLENDYVKLCVLPDIGGRLFYAIDKTNGYDIFYHQHVIKPSNVGMLGAWISGGVEWNVFHHHRASSQYPIDWRLVENEDGSKTIWLGEIEPRQRMSWAIGVTLHPDKSYIEITGRLVNDTYDRNSFLYWSNVATHANENYQIIFPENTDFGTYHAKNSYVRWPVADAPYCDNSEYIGRDISWWKNLPGSASVFVNDLKDDFIGGYDHGKNAGTMLVGDHNINKGGKFWLWGPRAYGHMWECVSLTDDDGPYVELMTAAYSDNQPDYSWINPYEVKEFTSYWYGIRDLDNVNRGNQYATLNMDIYEDGKVHLAANVTEVQNGARILVTAKDGTELYSENIDISPGRPWKKDIKISSSYAKEPSDVTMTLYDSSHKELLSYHPYKKDLTLEFPETVKPPKKPSEIESTEEVYYTGLRNLQFHNAHVEPVDYFEEVLRRDPLDTRANTQMGIWYRKRGDYDKAAKYLRTSLYRQTKDWTRPSDCEAMYNLGLVLKNTGKYDEAVDTLYRAAWDYAYASPAYYNLAQMSSINGDANKALQQADMAVKYNGMNLEAKGLKASLLRHEGKNDEAMALVEEILGEDPLNYYALREKNLLGNLSTGELEKFLRDQPETYIELALYYYSNGFEDEANNILMEIDSKKEYPTVKYYLGYLADKKGDSTLAKRYFHQAESLSTDYVFPFRLETVNVYNKALEYLPGSATTYYYLGNLYFDKQPQKAMDAWGKALEIDPQNAMCHRNMGWAYRFYKNNYDKAISEYEQAIKFDKTSSGLFLTELDELYEFTNAPLEKRYEMLTSHHDRALLRYDSLTREIRQMILHGDYDEALDLLLNNFFCRREHIEDLHDIYVDACLLAGLRAMKEGKGNDAVKYCLMADEYPEMHFYARLEYWPRNSQVYYLTGNAYEMVGDIDNARKYWKMAIDNATGDSDYNYDKALAMKKIDSDSDVNEIFNSLVSTGKSKETDYVERFFESFDRGPYEKDVNSAAYYTTGLGYLGLGDKKNAEAFFRKSIEQRNDNVWANFNLGNLR